MIPEFPTATDTEASTLDVWTSVELAAEQHRQKLVQTSQVHKRGIVLKQQYTYDTQGSVDGP